MSEHVIWRRLDTPGHDAALLTTSGASHLLQGTAVFKHPEGPACVNYTVEADSTWRTVRGSVQGFLAERRIDHLISHETEGWYLDGALIRGLDHLWDLDYGFTPATNILQLRRVAPAKGENVDVPVAWFDIDAATLTELPQRYGRLDETTYQYAAPSVAYQGLLELSANGFVKHYPQLWTMET